MRGKVLESFMYGYEAGAKYANSNIKVVSQYVGTFGDFGLGRSTASNMYRDGVDIIFAAAGLSGIGVVRPQKSWGPIIILLESIRINHILLLTMLLFLL